MDPPGIVRSPSDQQSPPRDHVELPAKRRSEERPSNISHCAPMYDHLRASLQHAIDAGQPCDSQLSAHAGRTPIAGCGNIVCTSARISSSPEASSSDVVGWRPIGQLIAASSELISVPDSRGDADFEVGVKSLKWFLYSVTHMLLSCDVCDRPTPPEVLVVTEYSSTSGTPIMQGESFCRHGQQELTSIRIQ